jgi:hypothetical protein
MLGALPLWLRIGYRPKEERMWSPGISGCGLPDRLLGVSGVQRRETG